MKFELQQLSLKNFKGIKDKEIKFYQRTDISGANEAGKTTIYDAFLWLLFDKDSHGKTGGIKPHDDDGNDLHHLDTTVTGVFLLDDKELTLQKTFSEKWTKKRGSATEEFTGHTTDYYWNDVPINKGDYQKNLYQIVDEDLFKLLSNTRYFLYQVDEKERRKMLMTLIGDDIDNEKIFGAYPETEELRQELNGRTIEDVTSMHKACRTKINKELLEVRPRIDEVYAMKKDFDFDELKKEKANLEKTIDTLSGMFKTAKKSTEVFDDLSAKIAKMNLEINKARIEASDKRAKEIMAAEDAFRDSERSLRKIEKERDQRADLINRKKDEVSALVNQLQDFREEWQDKAGERWRGSTTCPTCGQNIPKEQLEKAVTEYDANKKAKLEEIKRLAEETKTKIDATNDQIAHITEELRHFTEAVKKVEDDVEEKKALLESVQDKDVEDSSYIKTCISSRDKYMAQLEALEAQKEPDESPQIKEQIDELKRQLYKVNEDIAQENTNRFADMRISELEESAKVLGKEYEKADRMIALCETFTRAKMSMIKSDVDNKFILTQWKLFEEQINGGIRDVCRPLYKGSDLDQMNDGAKVLVGLDIINTFSKQKDIYIPVFVDNAETVTDYKGLDKELLSQQVRLTAMKSKKTLEIKEA